MIIIAGLGNFKKEFKDTYHNLGFLFLDYFRKKNNFPPFKENKKLFSFISLARYKEKNIILAKPTTFMNNSGLALKKILDYFKTNPQNLVVAHDDIDIDLGKIKISKAKESAGHKGVESIIDCLKTKNFWRIRIGIKPSQKIKAEKIVLRKITKKDKKYLKEAIKKADILLKDQILKSILRN